MKKYTLSFAQALEHKPANTERTARRNAGTGLNFDVTFQIWPNRQSMARSIRMQERGEPNGRAWRACQPLSAGEGY